jgi:hypothetical protein
MTTPNQILVVLLSGATTAAGLGDKLRVPMLVAKSLCDRHERDGLVSHTLIADLIPLYHLTDSGRLSAESLKPVTP